MIENVLNANDLNSNSIFSWDSIHARRGRSVFNYIHYARTGSTVIKMLLTIDERDQKPIETVFLIAICRQSGDKWLSKTLFLTVLIYFRR